MKVDHVLILAAGKGTRMGEIGKIIPKVIWPVFNKSILGLEVSYAKKLAPGAKIFINLYNYSEKIETHINEKTNWFEDVTIIKEVEVLDIGGAIHNLAEKLGYKGNLLILNSDQFLFCNSKLIKDALVKLETHDSLLFSYKVNSSDGYNALDVQDNKFLGIVPNAQLSRNTSILTYTGMSLINLSKIDPSRGESKFFETVANPIENKIYIEEIDNFEYWDFGTLARYYKSILELKKLPKSNFVNFLKEEKVFKNIELDSDKLSFNGFEISNNKISYDGIEDQI